MATNTYTTTYLLASLKRRGMLPSTSETLSTADFLALADEELQTYVVPELLSVREEYLVASTSVTVTSSTVSIPTRAIGGKLRNVEYSTDGTTFYPLSRIEPERASDWGTAASTTTPAGYSFQGNYLKLIPNASTGTVRLTYFARPNRLVATSAVGLITAINTSTKVVTAALPTTWTTGDTIDLVRGTPGFDCLGTDLVITAVSSTSATFSATLPTLLAVGDYVCLAGESPIPQIPVELHPLLAQRVSFKAVEALGDAKKAALAEAVCEKMRRSVMDLITPRAEGSARVIVARNGPGWGQGARYRRGT